MTESKSAVVEYEAGVKTIGTDQPLSDGHLFRFQWDMRGVVVNSSNYGPDDYAEADWSTTPVVIEIRAWSLTATLDRLRGLPFSTLMGETSDGDLDDGGEGGGQ